MMMMITDDYDFISKRLNSWQNQILNRRQEKVSWEKNSEQNSGSQHVIIIKLTNSGCQGEAVEECSGKAEILPLPLSSPWASPPWSILTLMRKGFKLILSMISITQYNVISTTITSTTNRTRTITTTTTIAITTKYHNNHHHKNHHYTQKKPQPPSPLSPQPPSLPPSAPPAKLRPSLLGIWSSPCLPSQSSFLCTVRSAPGWLW